MLRRFAVVAVLLCAVPIAARAQSDLIVEKKTFELPSYTTAAGATIKGVKVGWEAAGTLNADKSNAILITHFFSATSHAFGKYAAADKVAGYWDAIIGPGKAIDTNKYYVLSSDTLVNLNVNAPNVVTTGPATINPDTGKPYAMSFPVVSIKDFVNVQKALVESLGIRKLKAVVGASMGALQAYEWAASHPDMVERVIPVIGMPGADAFLIEALDIWAAPIRLDPKWNNGDYYGKEPPLEGLKQSLKIITLQANHWQWADKTFGLAPAEEGKDPAKAMGNRFKIEATLEAAAAARAATSDANHLLYLVKANQLAAADPSKIKAAMLLLYAPTDRRRWSRTRRRKSPPAPRWRPRNWPAPTATSTACSPSPRPAPAFPRSLRSKRGNKHRRHAEELGAPSRRASRSMEAGSVPASTLRDGRAQARDLLRVTAGCAAMDASAALDVAP